MMARNTHVLARAGAATTLSSGRLMSMKRLASVVVVGLTVRVIVGCSGENGDESALEPMGKVQQSLSDFHDPPRCGPRNCVAMCVTCEYDICRISGGTRQDCRAEMEICKDECGEQECQPGDPCDQ